MKTETMLGETPYKGTVAFLHPTLPFGGAETVSTNTAKYFATKGIRSIFFVIQWNQDTWTLPDKHCKVILLKKGRHKHNDRIKQLIESIKEYDIRFFFIASNYRYYSLKLREATDCKFIYWLHLTPNWKAIDKLQRKNSFLRYYPNRLLSPIINLFWSQYFKYYKQRVLKEERARFFDTDGHIVLCDAYKNDLIQHLGLSKEDGGKIYTIINTIELNKKVELNKKKEIIFVGRLSYPDKRPDRLVHIWSKIYRELPEWNVKVYGSGKEVDNLKKLIKELGVERISIEGFIKNPEEAYRDASILCLTSTFESWGLVLTEAQNNGVVPVAFNCSKGIKTILDKESGILVPPFDLDAYAQALKELCLNDKQRQELQENCLIKREEYTQERNDAVWRSLLGEDFFV